MVSRKQIEEQVFEKKTNFVIWLTILFFVAAMLIWPMVKPLLSRDDGMVKELEVELKKQQMYRNIVGNTVEYPNREKIDSLTLELIKQKK